MSKAYSLATSQTLSKVGDGLVYYSSYTEIIQCYQLFWLVEILHSVSTVSSRVTTAMNGVYPLHAVGDRQCVGEFKAT